jgi:PRTRC genetic system ThiF family protein
LSYGKNHRRVRYKIDEKGNKVEDHVATLKDIYRRCQFRFHVIGAGGTGGYVIRDLSRLLYALTKRDDTFDFEFIIYDGDEVEEKNLLRQNFLPHDLGKSKAEVMALRHSSAFGIPIYSCNTFLDEEKMNDIVNSTWTKGNREIINIVIGCVDNNNARRIISKEISSSIKHVSSYRFEEDMFHTYWIDAGNKRTSGQVIFGGREIPIVTSVYPDILDPEKDSKVKVSCAEALMDDEQNIFVNLMAANLSLNFVRKIIFNEVTSIHGVDFNIDGKTEVFALGK